ncbi:hypothetical protein RB195_005173 [Necator americanus]|uniref:Tyrosine-protein kinase n=1 Tax=Necator americanus TaxID=51031 RepID=A0ABR1BLJ3_NECAM
MVRKLSEDEVTQELSTKETKLKNKKKILEEEEPRRLSEEETQEFVAKERKVKGQKKTEGRKESRRLSEETADEAVEKELKTKTKRKKEKRKDRKSVDTLRDMTSVEQETQEKADEKKRENTKEQLSKERIQDKNKELYEANEAPGTTRDDETEAGTCVADQNIVHDYLSNAPEHMYKESNAEWLGKDIKSRESGIQIKRSSSKRSHLLKFKQKLKSIVSLRKQNRSDSIRGICRKRVQSENNILPPSATKELEDQVCYHGFRPRKDVANLLNEPGDFVVRATDSRREPEIVVSVLNENRKMINLTLRNESNMWELGKFENSSRSTLQFKRIQDLLNYYKKHSLPGNAKLRHAKARPSWIIKHESVVFDRTKDLIGTGNFSYVFKGIYFRTHEEKITVAIKVSHGGLGSTRDSTEEKEARGSMLAEAEMMSYYAHRHIVELYGVACAHPPVLVVMEYCPGGNLQTHLITQKDEIEVGERIVYALEAARGMRFLHRKNCIHRDLAARNCLISSKGRIKISDFGLSKTADQLEKMDGIVLDEPAPQIPLRWMAPESLRRPMKFSKKSDVWSFGMLLYEIFNQGEKPWKDEPAKKIATMIRRCKMPVFPQHVPREIPCIAAEIWVQNPDYRPTMKDINHSLDALSKKYAPPEAKNFSLNKLPGVFRADYAGLEEKIANLLPSSPVTALITESIGSVRQRHRRTAKIA